MMSDKSTLRHIQIPNDMLDSGDIGPFDLIVYASIKRFMNVLTKEAWPSMGTLKKLIGAGQDRILKSINKMSGKYFHVSYRERKKVYTFNTSYIGFEPFSFEFLDGSDLNTMEKSYVMALQQFMFKDVFGVGRVKFSTRDLSLLINMPEYSIYKCDRELQKKGYLAITKTNYRDFHTGLPRPERIFNLEKLHQSIVWQLRRHSGGELIAKKFSHRLHKEDVVVDINGSPNTKVVNASDVKVELI